MKKLMILTMVAIMSLGLLGVGYALWSETLHINGTVSTGNVGVELSGPVIIEWGPGEALKPTIANCAGVLSADGNSITVTVTNAYPSYECYVIFDVHGVGNVPAHVHQPEKMSGPSWVRLVTFACTTPVPPATPVCTPTYNPADPTNPDPALWTPTATDLTPPANSIPNCYPAESQLHASNRVWCAIYIHFKDSDNVAQNATINFSADILAHQFNEEPPSPPTGP